MEVKISELKQVFLNALTHRGLTVQEAHIVMEPFLEAELSGKKTHGISKFFLIDEAIRNRQGKPEIIRDKFNYALIDAHKELGYLSAQFATDILIKKTQEFGNAIVATVNSYYYSIAGMYARKVAEAGFVSIITNNGGPAVVTPYGGTDPILGTNPIAIGIPYKGRAIILDMATSKRTWGEINLAKVENRLLDANCFYDGDGEVTTEPSKAMAIKPFGEAKGAGLNFMLEILTGAFVGAKMGLQSQNGYDLGFLFMAYSPEMFSSKIAFDASVEQLADEIKGGKKETGVEEIYLPGEQAAKKIMTAMDRGSIIIADSVWENLVAFSSGLDVKAEAKLIE